MKADIPGYGRPKPIGESRRIPDIDAKKGGRQRLIEVETKNSLDRDSKQHQTFRRSAGQKPRTTFEIMVTDE